jgi:hypothetical protein
LKNTLLGQFGKSKWQSYFELLHLPMEMQGLKPSVLMGKLKQYLTPGVSPDKNLFLAMFLIRLQSSMRESVEAGAYGTAVAMVKAADALWDARGGHNPTFAAASTQRSRSSAPSSGKRGDKWSGNARPKSRPPSRPDFHSFQNPGNGMSKFHNLVLNRKKAVQGFLQSSRLCAQVGGGGFPTNSNWYKFEYMYSIKHK